MGSRTLWSGRRTTKLGGNGPFRHVLRPCRVNLMGSQIVLGVRSKDGQAILRELPDLSGALSALTKLEERVSFP